MEDPQTQNDEHDSAFSADLKSKKRRIIKNLLIVSVGFLLCFTAYGSLEKLQSSLHSDETLGLACLIAVYSTFVVSCLFVPSLLIGKLGCKYTLMLAMGGFSTFAIAHFYPKYWTLLPTSAVVGKSNFLSLIFFDIIVCFLREDSIVNKYLFIHLR